MTEPQKTCKKCGTSYPLSGFNKLSRSTDGHHGWCRGCSKSAAMEWKSKNRELCRELYARWVAANPEKIKAKNKSRYEKNKEAECKAAAAWRAANPERVREYGAEWREGNRDIARKNSAQWRAENPDAVKAHHQNRRAMKKMAGGKLSAGLAKQLLKLQKGKCACCGMPLGVGFHMDHVMPLALGGSNTDDNMQLLRATCNLQKHDKHPVDFMQQRGFLL